MKTREIIARKEMNVRSKKIRLRARIKRVIIDSWNSKDDQDVKDIGLPLKDYREKEIKDKITKIGFQKLWI